MPKNNFPDDELDTQYLDDDLFGEDVIDVFYGPVGQGGFFGADGLEEYKRHYVAWVPLSVFGVMRTTIQSRRPIATKPAYVQSSGPKAGVNIGPESEWEGRHIAVFVLDEAPDEKFGN